MGCWAQLEPLEHLNCCSLWIEHPRMGGHHSWALKHTLPGKSQDSNNAPMYNHVTCFLLTPSHPCKFLGTFWTPSGSSLGPDSPPSISEPGPKRSLDLIAHPEMSVSSCGVVQCVARVPCELELYRPECEVNQRWHSVGLKSFKSYSQASTLGKWFIGTNKMRQSMKILEGSSQWPNLEQFKKEMT